MDVDMIQLFADAPSRCSEIPQKQATGNRQQATGNSDRDTNTTPRSESSRVDRVGYRHLVEHRRRPDPALRRGAFAVKSSGTSFRDSSETGNSQQATGIGLGLGSRDDHPDIAQLRRDVPLQ
jgi:hypothetical protein